MTYNVFGSTLNLAQSINPLYLLNRLPIDIGLLCVSMALKGFTKINS